MKFGRRSLTPHQQAEALQRLARGDTQRTVAALLGVDQATIPGYHGSRADREVWKADIWRRINAEDVSLPSSRSRRLKPR